VPSSVPDSSQFNSLILDLQDSDEDTYYQGFFKAF